MNLKSPFIIAHTTFKGFARDRLFYALMVIALLFISFSYFIATLTIVEERKLVLDFGFTAISFSGILVAIFIGISAMAKEIENRTIYTVLSKPISRSVYLVGKFLGCVAVLFVVHALSSLMLLLILFAWKADLPNGLFACFFLMMLESIVILSISSVLSVYSSSFLAAAMSFAFFLIGRSGAALQTFSQKAPGAAMKILAKSLYWFLPNLERYNIRDVVAYGKPYPHEMLPWGMLYCVLYVILCLTLSSWIFSKRDLP